MSDGDVAAGIRRLLPRTDRRELAAIMVGGCIGAVVRAAVSDAWTHHASEWPWATFMANLVGAFALGFLVTRLEEGLPVSAYRRPFVGTGICGALTTFATMQVEILTMLDHHAFLLAGGYALASVGAGFAAVVVGTKLARAARLAR